MIELEDTKKGGLDSRWFNGEDDPEKFKKQLTSQTWLWRRFLKILKELYRNSSTLEYDFKEPHMHERMLFNEGYKKALIDIYKLVPSQRDDQ
jgi:hypothetical protein